MKVRFTSEARRELRSIGEYPLAHRVVHRKDGRDLRRRVYADHLIFYVVPRDAVDIVHGARDVDALLSSKPFG